MHPQHTGSMIQVANLHQDTHAVTIHRQQGALKAPRGKGEKTLKA